MRDERDPITYSTPDAQLMPGFGLNKNYTATMWQRRRQSRRADKFIADMRASGELDLEEHRSKEVRKIVKRPVEPPAPWSAERGRVES